MHMSLCRSTGSAAPARATPCTDRTSRSLLTVRLHDILGASFVFLLFILLLIVHFHIF